MRIETGQMKPRVEGRVKPGAPKPLVEGDITRGEVVSAKGERVVLRTPSGALVKATLIADADVKEGEELTLRVLSQRKDQIVLQLVEDEGSASGGEGHALAEAGLKETPRNALILQAFEQAGIAVRPEWLRAAASLLDQHPQMSLEEALLLAANNIKAIPEELAALSRLADGAKATEALDGIVSQLMRFLESGEFERADAAAPPLAADASQGALLQSPASAQQAQEGQQDGGFSLVFSPPSQDAVDSFARFLAVRHPIASEALPQNMTAGALTVVRAASLLPPEESTLLIQAFAETVDPTWPPETSDALATAMQRAAEAIRLPQELAANDQQELVRNILGFVKGLYARVGRGEEPPAQQVQAAAQGLRPGVETVRRSLLTAAVPEGSAVLQQTGELLEQTRLTDALQRFVYLQIPMQMGQNTATAEFYVLRRDRQRKKIDPENATMLIALETEHIGRVESMVRVEGRAVSLRFLVGSERIADAFIESIPEMQALLGESRYRLVDIRCQLLDEPVTPLTVEKAWYDMFGASAMRVDVLA